MSRYFGMALKGSQTLGTPAFNIYIVSSRLCVQKSSPPIPQMLSFCKFQFRQPQVHPVHIVHPTSSQTLGTPALHIYFVSLRPRVFVFKKSSLSHSANSIILQILIQTTFPKSTLSTSSTQQALKGRYPRP